MSQEKVTKVFTVRDRPVGYQAGRWGGALVAVERGEFPISSTGFWSLSGAGEAAVTSEFMEARARVHEREREGVLQRLREAQTPEKNPTLNYIQASGAYEQALQYGYFAMDRDRASLWAGASRLLCMVDADVRFQPAPDSSYVAWTKEHCDAALARARELKALLIKLATGEFPAEMPVRLSGVGAYFALPPKIAGEPRIELAGYTAEMALNLPTAAAATQRKPFRAASREPTAAPQGATQLGLFDSPSVATRPAVEGATGFRTKTFHSDK